MDGDAETMLRWALEFDLAAPTGEESSALIGYPLACGLRVGRQQVDFG